MPFGARVLSGSNFSVIFRKRMFRLIDYDNNGSTVLICEGTKGITRREISLRAHWINTFHIAQNILRYTIKLLREEYNFRLLSSTFICKTDNYI